MDSTPLTPDQITTLLSLGAGSGPSASFSPEANPENFEFFAFVVDGQISAIFIASKEHMQDYISTWSSNPLTVKLTPEQKNVVAKGWNYNHETGGFSAPE